ncbi:MAG: hypothetical protein ACOZQL_32675 [Myxococcota bacterium]
MSTTRPNDMLLAVLGVQLGYLSAEDALAAARELAQPGETRSISEFLVARGILDRARAQVLERLAARAVAEGGGTAAKTLELLPASLRELTATPPPVPQEARVGVVDEQPHRYFPAPRADRPPEELGRGAFARVVLMHDTVLGRDVAWREPLVSGGDDDAQLLSAARQQAGFEHPAVVPVFEVGRGARGLYVTQRRVSRRTLADALTEAPRLADRLALVSALRTVADCLARAHEREVFHGALDCRHVSLGRFGEVYVLGWGPPVPAEERETAAQEDLRALGAMLHEVVTGLPPPVMGTVRVRGAPEDLLGLCRQALRGEGSVEQFALELKAWSDGRTLASFHYSSWQLFTRAVQRHRRFSVMAATAAVVLVVAALVATMRVREERDHARQLARRFLDDVALRLRAQPGVEPLLEQVTASALEHYERTTELRRAPREERLRVASAMARLGAVSTTLGRGTEAARSLDFATGLLAVLPDDDADVELVRAELALARAGAPGAAPRELRAAALEARSRADAARASRPQSFEARRLGAGARLLLAEPEPAGSAVPLLDEAIALLEVPVSAADELLRRQTLARAIVLRAQRAPRARAVLEELVRRVEALRERAMDDVELQAAAARARLLAAEACEAEGATAAQHAHADQAAALARDVATRRSDRAAFASLVIEAELLASRPAAALERARAAEASGFAELAPLTAEAAFFSADWEQARALAARPPANTTARMVLVRALAAACLERASDAVIQARALKGSFGAGPWPAERLVRLLEAQPASGGAGQRAVRDFAAAWAQGDGEAAIAGLIASLEAQLPR